MSKQKLAQGFRSPTLRRIFQEVVRQGWTFRWGGDHVVVYPPDGSRPLILSTTAYDGPVMKRMVSRFRKAGLKLED